MKRESTAESQSIQQKPSHERNNGKRRSKENRSTTANGSIINAQQTAGNQRIQRHIAEDAGSSVSIVQSDDDTERNASQVASEIDTDRTQKRSTAKMTTIRPASQTDATTTERSAPKSVESTVQAPGRPLDPDVRDTMEKQFGDDFGDVRIHRGTKAARSATEIDARAYTLGNDVVFNHGEYDPETVSGRRLLAHELTHVVQQRRAKQPPINRQETKGSKKTTADEGKTTEARSRTQGAITKARARARLDALLKKEGEPGFIDRIDPNGPNLRADVSDLQLYLWDVGLLPFSVLQSEFAMWDGTAYSPMINPSAVPETMAAFRQYRTRQKMTHTMAGMTEQVKQLRKETDPKARRKKAMELRKYVRGLLSDYPPKVNRFILQAGMTPSEKTEVLGRLNAAVARMEFLSGTIVLGGTGSGSKYDWESGNKSDLIAEYSAAGAWCTKFATKVRQMVTGQSTADSGLKLGPWETATPKTKGAGVQYIADYSEEYGGAFAGPGKGTYKGYTVPADQRNPWISLRQDLSDLDKREERVKRVETFFDEEIKPQAGDFMVVRRIPSDPTTQRNRFRSGKSHTTMIEKVKGYKLYTIEGNKRDRVTGRIFDLTNPKHVREIIWIGRESILSAKSKGTEAQRKKATQERRARLKAREQAASMGFTGGDQVTPEELLGPVQRINRVLQAYATMMGYIDPTEGDVDAVATMVKQKLKATDKGAK